MYFTKDIEAKKKSRGDQTDRPRNINTTEAESHGGREEW